MLPFAPPRIPANELRPGRYWYAIAAAIVVVLIASGVAVAVYQFKAVSDAVDTHHRFANGDTVSLRLGPDSEKSIWIKERGPSDDQKCSIAGPGDPRLGDPGIDFYWTSDETWNPLFVLHVSRPGTYEVTCESRGPSEYAVGDSGGFVDFMRGSVWAIVLPLCGVGIALAIVIVVAVRRSDHRKRLQAERLGPASGWGPAAADGERHTGV
ncbi:hypothetical protein MHW47_08785 [Streptomyces sp. OfavH-34-F]|uniref:hypothetical protein n=1 Tax=Streptomyces sp. OfavH-34-F TaxID=2917760 RepID=UPI001EF3C5BA|nr:hypothetical protein [Streptomyces sp. OfavH-34-F]MCG7524529.1 hypothetical protein [Streptomyces sp. OfavH-34-F]